MNSRTRLLTYLLILLLVSLVVGAGLASIQPGAWWIGWLGFSGLLLLGLVALATAWRWAGGGRTVAWMIGLALFLRLAAGVTTYLALPVNGHNVPDDKAGYVFTDAHRRDDQAWELAQSGKPITAAFDKTFYTDQYGGLLAISALTYKIFSPDTHRPLIVVLLAALTAALGVPLLLKAARLLTNERLAGTASWLFVLYPESVLTGGAQMREPFLLTFIALVLLGFALWVCAHEQKGWWWLGAGMVGMLLVSPAVALASLVLLGGWLWSRGEHRRLPWPVIVIAIGLLLLGILFLAWSLSRSHDFASASPIGIILNWMRNSVKWVIYQLGRGSGQIQNVFSKLNPLTQFLFVVGYGITQPVLPPAFFAPTTLTWRLIAIFRATGWYFVLPFLLYAPIAAWRSKAGMERRAWIWLSVFVWSWIVVSAVRAGGTQWDNPRYRLIFFGVEALVAAYAWVSWRERSDPWFPRIVALEILCVLLFTQWYVARYLGVGVHLPIMAVLGLGIAIAAVILVGGWLWDGRHRRQADDRRRV
ncbi:MAG TPA: hypothetical protein VF784_11725 [Anaerolineales bacterium]